MKDGKIIEGQGIAGDALKAVDEFSFMDLVRKIEGFGSSNGQTGAKITIENCGQIN